MKKFKKLKPVICALLAFILTSSVVLAATWEYYFPTTLVDTSNTTRQYYPAMLEFGGDSLVDSGKIDADGLDTNLQIGSTDLKYMMSTGNVTAVIPNFSAASTITANLYTGYSPDQPTFPVITGAGGSVNVTDNSSIELGDDWLLRVEGHVNTDNASDKNVYYKNGASSIYISPTVSGNITAGITIEGTSITWITPDVDDGAAGWNNPANAHNENTGDWSNVSVAALAWSSYLVMDLPVSTPSIQIRYWTSVANALVNQLEIDVYENGGWTAVQAGVFVIGAWQTVDIGSLVHVEQIRARFYNSDAALPHDGNLHEVAVNQAPAKEVSATGISSDNITLEVGIEVR